MDFYAAADGSPTTVTATAPPPRPIIANAAAAVDGAGRTVATFTAPANVDWLVRRIVVQSNTQGTAYVYVGGQIAPANLVSGTYSGLFDENDAHQPYLVPAGQSMFVVWTAGGVCQARIEYVEA